MDTKTTVRFKTGIAGCTEGERLFGYEPGDVASIDAETAKPWLARGIAELVEVATAEPKAERAVRVLGRRHGR